MVPGTDGFGWLPFFHDNGLIGQVMSGLMTLGTGHMMPTERFASNPGLWFKYVSEVGARILCGPSSAWEMAIRLAAKRPEGVDLSRIDMGILAAEMIDPSVVDRLRADGANLGLRPNSVASAYGMAEASLALTITPIGRGIQIDEVDLDELVHEGHAVPPRGKTKRIASCGVPVEGVELRIMGSDGPVGERVVGEVQAKTPSLMSGYRGQGATDPFADGWLKTGDLGYLAGGELYVTGRIKDLVIVSGKNYLPDDLEWAASRVDALRVGRSVAFNPPGDDGHVVVAVELAGAPEYSAAARQLRNAVLNATGVNPRTIVVLPKGSIPRTTSGKIKRAAIREAWTTGALMEMALATDPVPGGSGVNGDGHVIPQEDVEG